MYAHVYIYTVCVCVCLYSMCMCTCMRMCTCIQYVFVYVYTVYVHARMIQNVIHRDSYSRYYTKENFIVIMCTISNVLVLSYVDVVEQHL